MHNLSNQERITELSSLYELADSLGVAVYSFDLPESRAVSLMDEHGGCVIGMDNSRAYSTAEEKTMLAHELGHCETARSIISTRPFRCGRSVSAAPTSGRF